MIESLMPGALLIILLGYFKVFARVIKKAVPQFIGGVVVLILGISLSPVAIKGVVSTGGNLIANVISGLVAAGVLILFMVFSYKSKKIGGILRLILVILALIIGTNTAVFFGIVDFTPVREAVWFQFPQLFHFGTPKFDLGSCLLMIFIYMVILLLLRLQVDV